MKTTKIFILPWYIKYIGAVIILLGFLNGLMQILSDTPIASFFDYNSDIKVFAVYAMFILGLTLMVFSKEKIEDEYLNYIRLKSFLISIAIHSMFFFIFSFTSLTLPIVNFPAIILMDSVLLIYIIAFHIQKISGFYNNRNEK
jgi:hypothetical protein